jgi:hypothetical protein
MTDPAGMYLQLEAMEKIELDRKKSRLWTPQSPRFARLFVSSAQGIEEGQDDENPGSCSLSERYRTLTHSPIPDIVQGVDPEWEEDFGHAEKRNPDALPPRNLAELILSVLYEEIASLGRGNALFALKAGLLTVLLCLPLYVKSSAGFAYSVLQFLSFLCTSLIGRCR